MESVNCLLIPIGEVENSQSAAFSVQMDNKNIDLIVLGSTPHFHVYLNQCPHQGRRLDYAPGQFLCKSGNIICALHGATFELSTGLCVQGPCRGESLIKLEAILLGDQLRVDVSNLA